jgi:hypothetical protein
MSPKLKFLMIRVWLFDKVCTLLGLENAYKDLCRRATVQINKLYEEAEYLENVIKERDDTIKRLDRNTSLDVRSSLELLNFENMGEIIWIKVSDDRMLRADVFNQIRDWMRTHGKEHSILVVTGTNVTFQTMTEDDLIDARLRRMTQEERAASL